MKLELKRPAVLWTSMSLLFGAGVPAVLATWVFMSTIHARLYYSYLGNYMPVALFIGFFLAPPAVVLSLILCYRDINLTRWSGVVTFLTVGAIGSFAVPVAIGFIVGLRCFFLHGPFIYKLAALALCPIIGALVGIPVGIIVGLPLAMISAIIAIPIAFRGQQSQPRQGSSAST